MPGKDRQDLSTWGCLPGWVSGRHFPLWTEFVTDASENIAFSQIRLWMVITGIYPRKWDMHTPPGHANPYEDDLLAITSYDECVFSCTLEES